MTERARQAWQTHVAQQEIAIALRFSYFGQSGWKSDFSRDKDLLFAPERLTLRLALLESLPLPSLAAQSDRNFHLHVLTAWSMPDWAKGALHEACTTALPGQFTLHPRPTGEARDYLRGFLRRRYGDNRVLQVVLDDDDGLSVDHLATLRQEMAALPPPETPEALRFVSFARGYGLDVTDLATGAFALYRHRYPFINLGLGMSAPAAGMNLYSIRHRLTPREHPHALNLGRRMFIRTLHARNDSRVEITPRWEALPDWRHDADIITRFPWLCRL